jgi:hypothetical protein
MDDLSRGSGNRYPYDPTGDAASEALEYMWMSERDGELDIPTFARRTLERLREVGLLHRTDTQPPANIRRARFDGQQDLWIRFNTRRTSQGYKAMEVMEAPRSDRAILAAMVAWTSDPVDFEQLRPAIAYAHGLVTQGENFEAAMDDVMQYLMEGEPSLEDFKRVAAVLNTIRRNDELLRNFRFLEPLMRFYKPEIADCSAEEYWKYIEQACRHVKDYLESLSRLQAFLEYGAPGRKLTPSVKRPQRDVQAAVLHDVEGIDHREILERMRIAPLDPQEFRDKGEYQTVRKMISRGRDILEQAFGRNGWQAQAATLKEEIRWWQSLSPEERKHEEDIEMEALINDVSIEEARRIVVRRQ